MGEDIDTTSWRGCDLGKDYANSFI